MASHQRMQDVSPARHMDHCSSCCTVQAAKALMEEQLLHEQKARLAAEASNKTLTQQLAEQRSALVAVHQQVRATALRQTPPTPPRPCSLLYPVSAPAPAPTLSAAYIAADLSAAVYDEQGMCTAHLCRASGCQASSRLPKDSLSAHLGNSTADLD